MSRRLWAVIALAIVVVGVVFAVPWLYLNVLRDDPPDRLTFEDMSAPSAADGDPADAVTAGGIDGAWTVAPGSQVGYRVQEVLFAQDSVAVGRTTELTGTLEIRGTTITGTDIEVDMTTLVSDDARRDGQFRYRIMDTDTYPTATFRLTEPITLAAVPDEGEEVAVTATGELTLRGVTREVTFELTARPHGARLEAIGVIDVDFDAFEIPDVSGGPVSLGRTGELELLLAFTR